MTKKLKRRYYTIKCKGRKSKRCRTYFGIFDAFVSGKIPFSVGADGVIEQYTEYTEYTDGSWCVGSIDKLAWSGFLKRTERNRKIYALFSAASVRDAIPARLLSNAFRVLRRHDKKTKM